MTDETVNPEELDRWLSGDVDHNRVDDVLEFLEDRGLLNEKGKEFRDLFWRKYVQEK